MKHTEKTISEKVIFKGKVFTVKNNTVLLENGKTANREIVYHNGGAGVLAIDNQENIYLIKQFRAPFEKEILEIPAGKLNIDEDPFIAAKRELLEETGLVANEYIPLGEVYPTVGFCSEVIYIYLAKDLELKEQNLDDDEFVSLIKMPFKQAFEMCISGEIKDSKTLVSILKAKEILHL